MEEHKAARGACSDYEVKGTVGSLGFQIHTAPSERWCVLSIQGIFLGFSRGCTDRCGQGCSDQIVSSGTLWLEHEWKWERFGGSYSSLSSMAMLFELGLCSACDNHEQELALYMCPTASSIPLAVHVQMPSRLVATKWVPSGWEHVSSACSACD